jgi:hypothetical protein
MSIGKAVYLSACLKKKSFGIISALQLVYVTPTLLWVVKYLASAQNHQPSTAFCSFSNSLHKLGKLCYDV